MTKILDNLKYTETHEWIKIEGDTYTMGVTDYAQNALGDIVFVELPEVGSKLQKGKSFGVIESIKSVSDLYAPIAGEVIAINEELPNTPDLCNSDPYGSAWLIKAKITNASDANILMDASTYTTHCNQAH
jgi:glycine cleavage system H protein